MLVVTEQLLLKELGRALDDIATYAKRYADQFKRDLVCLRHRIFPPIFFYNRVQYRVVVHDGMMSKLHWLLRQTSFEI